MKITKKIFLSVMTSTLLCLFLFSSGDASIYKDKTYEIKFGIIDEGHGADNVITSETLRIPKLLRETGFVFGFIVWSEEKENFKVDVKLELPSPPEKATIDGVMDLESLNGGMDFIYSISTETGRLASMFTFDDSDPLGEWKITIKIDGRVIKEVEFTVFEPEDN